MIDLKIIEMLDLLKEQNNLLRMQVEEQRIITQQLLQIIGRMNNKDLDNKEDKSIAADDSLSGMFLK